MILRVFDTETCGLEVPDLQIVQIACVDLVSREGGWDFGQCASYLVDPGRPIPFEAMAIHHKTNAMVAEAPPIAEVLPLVFDGIPDAYIAHNLSFERKVLAAAGLKPPPDRAFPPRLCTYKGAVIRWPECPSHKNQVLRYFLALEDEPTAPPPHDALGDVLVTAGIARKILESFTIDQWSEISSNPVLLPRVTFGEHAKKNWSDVPWSYLNWVVHKSQGPWEEDILFTAKHWHEKHMARSRGRAP